MGTSQLTKTLVIILSLVGGALAAAMQGGVVPVAFVGTDEISPTQTGSYTVTVSDIAIKSPRNRKGSKADFDVSVSVSGSSAVWGTPMPRTVVVPAGQWSKQFNLTALSTAPSGNTTLTVSCGGESRQLVVTVD